MQNIKITNSLIKGKKKQKVLVSVKLIAALAVLGYFVSIREMYFVKNDFFLKRITFVLGMFFIMAFFSVADIQLSKKADRMISVFLMIVSPFSAWIVSEVLINEPVCAVAHTGIMQKDPLWIGIGLTVIIVLYFILLFVTNNIGIAAVMLNFIAMIFSTVVCIVYELRGIPMMASDVLTIRTAVNVVGEYTIQLTFKEYAALLMCFVLMYVFLQLKEIKVCKKIWTRGVLLIIVAVCSVVFTQKIILSDYMKEHDINIRMFRPMESYQKYGAVTTFVRSIGYAVVQKPDGYSVERVQQIIKEYSDDQQITNNVKKHPNIITILNETYSDIKVLGDFTTNEDYMPFYRSMKENCVKGYTYASIVGGQTANTEFELLTGNTLGFLSPDITAFQLYIHENMPSIVSNLKENGYSGNKALHPFNPYNYNRPAVYKYLGFSDFLSKKDFSQDVKMLREYISDDADIDKVISEYEENRKENSAKPFFMYNLTIQNHSPYDQDYSNFKQSIKLEDSKSDAYANRYLNLVKYSDASLKKIVKYFENCKEPTIILFLGDHQPRLTDVFLNKITNGQYAGWSSEEMMKRYQVPFVIWANYNISEQYIEKTSMNYLQSILMETAGVKMSGYQKFLNEIRKEIPTITSHGYWGKNGEFYEVDDKKSPYYDIIQEYRIIQYNMMFDSKNRVNSFFEVDQSK